MKMTVNTLKREVLAALANAKSFDNFIDAVEEIDASITNYEFTLYLNNDDYNVYIYRTKTDKWSKMEIAEKVLALPIC